MNLQEAVRHLQFFQECGAECHCPNISGYCGSGISVWVLQKETLKQVVKITYCHHVMQSGGILSYISFKTWVQSFMLFVLK